MEQQKIAIIIGAGPAGLTAAYELAKKTNIRPIIFEMSDKIGGISRTENYKGNRIDIGPHRFFSKSDRVLNLWEEVLPLQGAPAKDDKILGNRVALSEKSDAPDPEKTDRVMLFKNRLTRIYFLKKFFNYPISLNRQTISNLGIIRMFKIGLSYFCIKVYPIKEEKNLEDFYINRFGRELYETFFKDYTKKVWGVDCKIIPKDWGAQRVKGLSITKVLGQAIKNIFFGREKKLNRKGETSLTESFLYPKFGAGHLYEEMAKIILSRGGEIRFNCQAVAFKTADNLVNGVSFKNLKDNHTTEVAADYVFSTMPMRDLIRGFGEAAPVEARTVAEGLVYRDFMTVGLLFKRMAIKNNTAIKTLTGAIPDNWIYVQEREARMGRLDVFNNFSYYMLKNPDLIWLGAEYFCDEGDELWRKSDKEMAEFAASELAAMGLADKNDLLDSTVIKQPKAYPAYFGSYNQINKIQDFTDRFENLFLIGRNGMHKYNNMDHSVLTAMIAVDNIAAGVKTKDNIWAVNAEEDYHESKK